jgi:hypothetical protein
MSTTGIELEGSYKNTKAGSNIDFWYGGGSFAYTSTAVACAAIPAVKRQGLTIGVQVSGGIVEYWWPTAAIADADLVLKGAALPQALGTADSPAFGGLTVNGPANFNGAIHANGGLTNLSLFAAMPPVDCATVAALPAFTAMDNGTAHVYTANANGALSVDGYTVLLGNDVLVKNETDQSYNGVFTLTQLGDATHPWKLTRRVYEQQPGNFSTSSTYFVRNGGQAAYTLRFSNPLFNIYSPGNTGPANAKLTYATYIGAQNSFSSNVDFPADVRLTFQSQGGVLFSDLASGNMNILVYHSLNIGRGTNQTQTMLDVSDGSPQEQGLLFRVRNSGPKSFFAVGSNGYASFGTQLLVNPVSAFVGYAGNYAISATQSGTAIAANADIFDATMVGKKFIWQDGTDGGLITAYTDARHVTVSSSLSRGSQTFTVSHIGLQLTPSGHMLLNTLTDDGTNALQVNGSGSFAGQVTASSFFNSSDIRLKQLSNDPVNHAALSDLPLIAYHWKDGRDTAMHYGHSAQQVEASYPDLVATDAQGWKSINYLELHTLQLAAMRAETDALKEKVSRLEKALNSQEVPS